MKRIATCRCGQLRAAARGHFAFRRKAADYARSAESPHHAPKIPVLRTPAPHRSQ